MVNDIPEDISEDIRLKLRSLFFEFRDVLSTYEQDIGRTTVCEHHIDTGAALPVRQPLRPQPLPYKVAIDQHLDQMLATGVIEPTVSE